MLIPNGPSPGDAHSHQSPKGALIGVGEEVQQVFRELAVNCQARVLSSPPIQRLPFRTIGPFHYCDSKGDMFAVHGDAKILEDDRNPLGRSVKTSLHRIRLKP